ncbi:hypothetical protein TNCV_2431661 [Trichonephila clavipes]|nr:hypothetical protein TNCV_2431661 [Trichonephila clavipes]
MCSILLQPINPNFHSYLVQTLIIRDWLLLAPPTSSLKIKKKPRLDFSHQSITMDQIDAFPEHISRTVMSVTLPEKPDALQYAARQGQVRGCINYLEPNTRRVFVLFCKDNCSCTCRDKQTTFGRTARAFLQTEQSVFTPVIRPPVAPVLIARPFTALPTPSTDSRSTCADTSLSTTCADITCADDTPCANTILSNTCADDTTWAALFTRSTICADSFIRSTCGRDFVADPYGRLFNRADHVVRIWRLLAARVSHRSYPEPQLLDTVPSLFDESNDLISFLDPFETVLAIEQQKHPWT